MGLFDVKQDEALPGFEHCDRERAAVLAEEQGAELTAELASTKGSIEERAGKIETLSPLFRGKGPQTELFSSNDTRTEDDLSSTKEHSECP